MANGNATITVDARLAAAYNAAPKTRQKKALSALRQALRAAPDQKTKAARLSKRETELLLRINRTLAPEKQRRYDELKEKREAETLTPAEYKELLRFVAEHQELWAKRLEAVVKLAQLRGVSPPEMLKQLGIDPRRYA
jgi:hypothetical protein